MVRTFAHRLFGKLVSTLANTFAFAGTAIAAETTQLTENVHAVIDLKVVLVIVLVGIIIHFAHQGSNRAAS